jgi:CubicO group peptidase (beta-lactamase class C family)
MRAHYLLLLITSCSGTIAFAQTSHSTKPDFSAIRAQLRAHVGRNDVPGLAIAVSRGGEVLWDEGFGWADRERHVQATPTTPFYIASVTKSVTAAAVLHLAERGKLNLDDPVNKYLGAAKVHSPVWNSSGATIRRVMSQTSGLTTFTRWCVNAADPNCDIDSEIERYGVLVWPPGEVFDYSNLSYGIMGEVVARVSAGSFESYLRRVIFQPLNMQDCYFVPGRAAKRTSAQYDQNTHARSPARISGHEGASGLYCSARDLLSFGMFNLKEYLGSGSPLSIRDIDDMHSAQPGTAGQYGFGWWIKQESGAKIISAQGGTTDAYALLELIPANEIAIVVIANSYSELVRGLERQIISVLLGSSPETPPSVSQPRELTPATLAGKWSGQILTYKAPVNITLDIGNGSAHSQLEGRYGSTVTNVSLDEGHFYGQLPGEPGLPDSPSSPFLIELDLALHDDKLIGAATFGPLPGEDGDQLPHFINLARTKPRPANRIPVR